MRKLFQKIFSLFLLILIGELSALGQMVPGDHVDTQLIAETETAFAGQELWIALRLDQKENWHTYWKNPGDAGKATEINWHLPAGVSAGEIVWPIPERLVWPIGLVDFGYINEIFLLIPLTISDDFTGATLDLSAEVKWLECDDIICIPKGAELALSVPFSTSNQVIIDPQWAEGFAQTRAALPRDDIILDSMFTVAEGKINLLVQATESIFENAETIRFIPGQHRVMDYNAEQEIAAQLSSLQLSQNHHERFLNQPLQTLEGVLVVTDENAQQTGYEISAQPQQISLDLFGGVYPALGSNNNGLTIARVFGYALLGGLILNLMPCVFPVLSLKVMGLVGARNSSLAEQRLHGLAYAAGVIIAFLLLAAVLLSLQAGGALVGWGFHLQSPWFVTLLIYLFVVMTLAMFGVIELGSSIMGAGSELSDKTGLAGSFYTGILAAVVASPCTAPFMGAALGFAFTQSMPVALTVFVALGLGMALPFLLISFVPALARLLPKPGQWMQTFKKLMAVPLFATVLWLLWVLEKQISNTGLILVVLSCLLISCATWLSQQRAEAGEDWVGRKLNAGVISLCLGCAVALLFTPLLKTQQHHVLVASETGIEPYSAARLSELRSEGVPVFVNMTAAWCITCLVNERVALSSDSFLAAMTEHNVVYLKGDWTNNDPEITEVLKYYQTSGVPLYLMFPADASQSATILPQILTETIMLDALSNL